ncbi:MAG: hypothetical protein R2838_00275 [Caldilineaceae bacterium]
MGAWQFIYDMIFDYGMMPTPSVAEQFGDLFESGNAATTTAGHRVVPFYANTDFAWDVVAAQGEDPILHRQQRGLRHLQGLAPPGRVGLPQASRRCGGPEKR